MLEDNSIISYREEDEEEVDDPLASYPGFIESQNDAMVSDQIELFLSQSNINQGCSMDKRIKESLFSKGESTQSAQTPEVREIISMDQDELAKLIKKLNNNILMLRAKIGELIALSKSREVAAKDCPISLLNLRLEVMLEYCSYLSLFSIMKLNGEDVAGHEIVKRLVFLKQFNSRLRPVHKKVDFQVTRFIGIANKVPFR